MFKENLVFVGSEEEVRKEHRKVVEMQDGRWWYLKRTLCL